MFLLYFEKKKKFFFPRTYLSNYRTETSRKLGHSRQNFAGKLYPMKSCHGAMQVSQGNGDTVTGVSSYLPR